MVKGGRIDAVDVADVGPRGMDDVRPMASKPKPGRFGIGIVIAVVVLCPEVALAFYVLLGVILVVRMHWLLQQGLNDLRQRDRS